MDDGQSNAGSWVRHLVDGEEQAVAEFWDQYGERLRRLADRHLTLRVRRRIGPEDIVQSACRTFFRRAQHGELKLTDSESLWRLMCAITLTKVREQVRFHFRQKRSVNSEQSDEGLPDDSRPGLPEAADQEPSAEEAVEFADQLQRLLEDMDEEEQQLVQLKLENYINEEIAERIGCSERTVRRILNRVKSRLARALEQSCLETA